MINTENICPDKLEPRSHLARESLLKAISNQMELIVNDMGWKAKSGLDKAEFARIESISGSMGDTIRYLSESAKLFKETEIAFREHNVRMQALVDLAHKIKRSEEV